MKKLKEYWNKFTQAVADHTAGASPIIVGILSFVLLIAFLWALAWVFGFIAGIIAQPFLAGFCLPVGC